MTRQELNEQLAFWKREQTRQLTKEKRAQVAMRKARDALNDLAPSEHEEQHALRDRIRKQHAAVQQATLMRVHVREILGRLQLMELHRLYEPEKAAAKS
ncbi:MAG: hypothetical protein ACYTED_20485 [Planctomycetota bacterium]